MLKADLHIHTSEDKADRFIEYNAYQLIDHAAALGFQVLSITNHNCLTYTDRISRYALERNILLIPGMEMTVQGKHVLAYGSLRKMERLTHNIGDLIRMKDRDSLFIAAHPYFPAAKSLGRSLMKWRALFDAIELCHLYTRRFDCNRRARRAARELELPMVGTSDCHVLRQLNTTYTLIDAQKDIVSVLDAIKRGNLVVVSSPLTLMEIGRIMYGILMHHTAKKIGHACLSLFAVMGRRAL